MFLKYAVVFLFLCFFATSRGDVQGDIQGVLADIVQRLSALEENQKNFEKTTKTFLRDIKKLLNDQNDDWTIRERIPKLSAAEVAHYQRYESGKKGIELYVELERIRDGKAERSMISMLNDINSQEAPSWSTGPLYEKLNKAALALIKNREEEEIEQFLKDNEGNIRSALHVLSYIKPTELRNVGKMVILRVLKATGDCKAINTAIEFNRADVDFVNDLSEACLESLSITPISKALEGIESIDSNKLKIKGYEKLLTIAKGDEDVLKVVDSILEVGTPLVTELRNKIPYNEETLKRMTENSTQTFRSQKLKAIQLRSLLENNPNASKIFDLVRNLQFNDDDHMDYAYIEDTFNMLPKPMRALLKKEKVCIVHEGRYVYAINESENVMVSEKSGAKPDGAGWSFHESDGEFSIDSEETLGSRKFTLKGDEVKVATKVYYPYSWKLNFIDLTPRVKIIDGYGKFLRIEGNRVALDKDIATIWEVVSC